MNSDKVTKLRPWLDERQPLQPRPCTVFVPVPVWVEWVACILIGMALGHWLAS